MTDDPAADTTVRPGALIVLFLLAFTALCVGTAFLPHDPYVRVQQIEKDALAKVIVAMTEEV
jgi:hypothetical protein